MAVVVETQKLPPPTIPIQLGPQGPFPNIALTQQLERRWLHYAFLSMDNNLGMVANISWLGPDPISGAGPRCMSIILVHRLGEGWRSSQFNAQTLMPSWSSFRRPFVSHPEERFKLSAILGSPAVDMKLERTSRPCTSQCSPIASNQHLRWQSETGIVAKGTWQFEDHTFKDVEAVGYHERVRGYWGWPELGGWVFGFANDPALGSHGSPETAVVFTLIQPLSPQDEATGSVMLWRNGRLRRHFPRRNVSVAVHGVRARDEVSQTPELANTLAVPPMAPVPSRLMITAQMGEDWVVLDFYCEAAARVVIPSETSLHPFSVHEVIGPCHIEGELGRKPFRFETYGIVEFAGGANAD